MIGLDTNVLVRYIVRDDPRQTSAATRLIEQHCTADTPGWIGVVVICELTWVLQSVYGISRDGVSTVMETLLTSNELRVESAETVWQALRRFRRGTADMADYLIGVTNTVHDASPTFTFDKRASTDSDFRLLDY